MWFVGESDQNSHSVDLADVGWKLRSGIYETKVQAHSWPQLFSGWILLSIQRINLYSLDHSICFDSTYPLGSDLSLGWHFPTFEQLKPAYSVKRVFWYVVKAVKIKITAKFRATRRLRFEDTDTVMSPERFGTFEKRAPVSSCWLSPLDKTLSSG